MATTKKPAAKPAKRRLGRGLTSLISAPVEIDIQPESPETDAPVDRNEAVAVAEVEPKPSPNREAAPGREVLSITLSQVHPRAGQPRQTFDEVSLAQLAESIRHAGLMQPILVRPNGSGGYEIIAGERRWRAARSLNLATIPAIVRDLDDERCAEWSLIENLQREDLNPIDRAEAFQRLIEEFNLTHQDVAERVSLDRSSVSNHLRLNELDCACKEMVRAGTLSMGHAKALLGIASIEDRTALAEQVARESWSVRELERRVKTERPTSASATTREPAPAHPQLDALQRRLGEHLGTKVKIVTGRKKGQGRLVIEFYDFDQFDGLLRAINFDPD